MVELFRPNLQNHKERKEERDGGREEGGREKQQFSVLICSSCPHTCLCKVTGHEWYHIPMGALIQDKESKV